MIKPERLRKGDKVAIVSLSNGMLGDQKYIHKYELGKRRLEEKFGLEVVPMPNVLIGTKYLKSYFVRKCCRIGDGNIERDNY